MNIPAHSHALPHLHIPTIHFIIPHTVDLPAWWWMGTYILVPWSCFLVVLWWFSRHSRREEEVRIRQIEEVLGKPDTSQES
ncbi:hypothetical protein BJI67_10345 [Acidihalobacter aeolianus]|uniref:Uncharacterized protein n=1 Tax=Acidihalobacter aeolianus TaxID=2792603 RepID=A0A1D8K8V7_9GAMM|nr:hypothetical protein [Acidihalobacter aeolianus]AOV17404.1 hypothetical protein BJI67_10345 [Acidihalobacter aeolianus]